MDGRRMGVRGMSVILMHLSLSSVLLVTFIAYGRTGDGTDSTAD
jgi:hypothetical protein